MIAFGIHCRFFIVSPIQLKTCGSNVFLFFKRENVRARKIDRVSEVLRAWPRPDWWKPLFLGEADPFTGIHPFLFKSFSLMEVVLCFF